MADVAMVYVTNAMAVWVSRGQRRTGYIHVGAVDVLAWRAERHGLGAVREAGTVRGQRPVRRAHARVRRRRCALAR